MAKSKNKQVKPMSTNTGTESVTTESPVAPVTEMSDSTVEEALKDDVQAPVEEIQSENQKPTPQRQSDKSTEQNNSIADTLVDPTVKVVQDGLIEKFDRYKTAMASGKPIDSEKTGASFQVQLWRMIDETLRRSGNEFTATFTTLLALIASELRSRGVMEARLRYRFFGALPLGREEASSFEAILSALVTVADPKSRALSLKQVDFAKAFRNYSDKTALARVVDYFNL